MNLKTREFSLSLKKYIESVDIPMEVKRIALKEIYEDIAKRSDEAISNELNEREKEKEGG